MVSSSKRESVGTRGLRENEPKKDLLKEESDKEKYFHYSADGHSERNYSST